MRHPIRLAFLPAAFLAYAAGVGPLFFGQPLLGTVLVLIGAGLELAFWRRRRAVVTAR